MTKSDLKQSNHSQKKEHCHTADIHDKLIINLRDLNRVLRFLYEGKASQKRILIILREVGSITQRELTRRLGIQPGSASEVLTKLEHSGLITRTASKKDRRTALIRLTEKGDLLALEAANQRNKRHAEMFSCLSENEQEELLSLLEKINEDWNCRYQETEKNNLTGSKHLCGNT